MRYIVNAAVEDFVTGEVVEIDPAMFADLIDGKFLSPIDEYGNRLGNDGEILVLGSTTEEQRRQSEGVESGVVSAAPDSASEQSGDALDEQ